MHLDKLLYMWTMHYMYIIKDSLLEMVYLEKGWNKKKIRLVPFFLLKMHNQMDYNNIVCPSSSRSKCEENPKLKWADKLAHYKHNCWAEPPQTMVTMRVETMIFTC